MQKLIKIILILVFTFNLFPQTKAEYPTCTYVEGMYICVQNGHINKVYCNYRDSQSTIKACQSRIRENHKYLKYYRTKWKKHCESSAQKQRGEYCQTLNENFLFYRDEFFNLFLENL